MYHNTLYPLNLQCCVSVTSPNKQLYIRVQNPDNLSGSHQEDTLEKWSTDEALRRWYPRKVHVEKTQTSEIEFMLSVEQMWEGARENQLPQGIRQVV